METSPLLPVLPHKSASPDKLIFTQAIVCVVVSLVTTTLQLVFAKLSTTVKPLMWRSMVSVLLTPSVRLSYLVSAVLAMLATTAMVSLAQTSMSVPTVLLNAIPTPPVTMFLARTLVSVTSIIPVMERSVLL